MLPEYAELHCLTNFSFLRGASHPEELAARAAKLGYCALAVTDECSLAGIVRAHVAAKEHGLKLIVGAELRLADGPKLALLATDRQAYGNLSQLITAARRRSQGVVNATDVDNVALKCGGATPNFAIVHADPYNRHIAELVGRLAGKVESGFLVGGLTSSRRQNLQVADGVVEGGLSGVSFADSVAVATRLTQGCSPLGPKHVVTASQHNVIIQLDGRAALDVFKEDIGEPLARDLNRVGGQIFAGLPISGSDTGDYLVRNLVGIDPANRLIAIGELLQPGASVMFCKRDTKTAHEDMSRMLESIRKGMYGRPRGGVYYTCIGRGASLFGPNSEELKMIREALGEFPLVGFFCNGEISHNRLYGYTGVLTLFV